MCDEIDGSRKQKDAGRRKCKLEKNGEVGMYLEVREQTSHENEAEVQVSLCVVWLQFQCPQEVLERER